MVTRLFIVLFCACLMIGCGDSKTAETAPTKEPMSQASMVPSPSSGAGTEQSMDATPDEKVGEVSMKDMCAASAISVLPGSENSKGDTYKRKDGGSKHAIKFDSKLSLNDIAEFYKKDGLDPKIEGDKLQSLGMTKNKSMVKVLATKQTSGDVIVEVTSLTYPKQ